MIYTEKQLSNNALKCIELLFQNQQLEAIVKINESGDEEQWFRGKDVTNILKYEDPKRALQNHVEKEDKTTLLDLKKVGESDSPTFS